jgi:hypothetical protein
MWCKVVAFAMPRVLSPPDRVRPWVLARLAIAAAHAARCAESGETSLDGPVQAIVAELLIGAWHHDLKERWLAGETSYFSA